MALGSVPFLSAQTWSAWKPDPVFHGIEVREHCSGFNEFAGRYLWDVQLRNTYGKSIDLAWSAEPALLRGKEAQADRALAVKPGEVVDAHHTAPRNCSAGLVVKVSEVKTSATLAAGNATIGAAHPKMQGRWQSKDPEPLRKELVVELSGKTVTGRWSSPNFNLQISSPLPEGVSGSVSVGRGEQN